MIRVDPTPFSPNEQPRKPCSLGAVLKCAIVAVLAVGSGFYLYSNGYAPKTPSPSANFLATYHARQVAQRLGDPNPARFTVFNTDSEEVDGGFSTGQGRMFIKKQMVSALAGDKTSEYTKEEALGFLAHEIGHDTLGHSQHTHPIWREYNELLETNCTGEELHLSLRRALRLQEKEADLFTVRVAEFAKGLINRLRRGIIGQEPEVARPSDSHPTTEERIHYLTEAVCQRTRGADPDLCTQCFHPN